MCQLHGGRVREVVSTCGVGREHFHGPLKHNIAVPMSAQSGADEGGKQFSSDNLLGHQAVLCTQVAIYPQGHRPAGIPPCPPDHRLTFQLLQTWPMARRETIVPRSGTRQRGGMLLPYQAITMMGSSSTTRSNAVPSRSKGRQKVANLPLCLSRAVEMVALSPVEKVQGIQ